MMLLSKDARKVKLVNCGDGWYKTVGKTNNVR